MPTSEPREQPADARVYWRAGVLGISAVSFLIAVCVCEHLLRLGLSSSLFWLLLVSKGKWQQVAVAVRHEGRSKGNCEVLQLHRLNNPCTTGFRIPQSFIPSIKVHSLIQINTQFNKNIILSTLTLSSNLTVFYRT